MRALLIAMTMAAAVAPACSKSASTSAGPAVTAGATVGVVVEIAGSVTATRGGATRTLAAGSEVSGDDRIATGADGKVAIELAHNGARWSLEANKSGVVAESVAWGLPKVSGPKGTNEEDMTSAGRHAERSAADTSASTAVSAGSGSSAASDADRQRMLEAAQNDADREAAKSRLQQLQREKSDMEARVAAAKEAAAKGERVKGVKVSKECLDNPLAKGCGDTDGKVSDTAVDHAPGGNNGDAIAHDPKVKACLATGATIHLAVKCHAGACAVTRPIAGVDDKVAQCVRDAVAAIKGPDATFTVDVKN